MPRALSIRTLQVADGARAEYLARAVERRATHSDTACNFWIFESDLQRGSFMEFVEGASADAVRASIENDIYSTGAALHNEVVLSSAIGA